MSGYGEHLILSGSVSVTLTLDATTLNLIRNSFAGLTAQLTQLQQQVKTMSDTIATTAATISAELDGISSDLTAIAAKLAAAGTVPQADIDAVNALATKAAALKTAADGMAA